MKKTIPFLSALVVILAGMLLRQQFGLDEKQNDASIATEIYKEVPRPMDENEEPLIPNELVAKTTGEHITTGETIPGDVLATIEEEVTTKKREKDDFQASLEKISITETKVPEGIKIEGKIPPEISSGTITKITVTSCEGNFSSGYDTPYTLKTYEYPTFKYIISEKYENVCKIPYKITFFGSDGEKKGEKEYETR